MQIERLVLAVAMAVTVGFLGWSLWVTDPRHPERLQRVRSWLF